MSDFTPLSPEDARRDADRIRAELANADRGTDPFVAAVRATRMPMIITDPRQPDNPVVFCNDAFCNLTGYSRREILGRNCRFLQGPETDPEVVARLRHAVQTVQSVQVDVRNHRKNGEAFWNRLLMAPVRGADGALAYFFASQVDVTLERERLAGLESHNAALMAELSGRLHKQQDGEARLRFAAEAGRLGIWDLDLETGELYASSVCRADFECAPDTRLTFPDLIAAIHPDDRAATAQALDQSIGTGADFDLEVRALRKSAAVAWIQLRAQVVVGVTGTPLRVSGVSQDITDRHNVAARRRALVELNDRLPDLDDAADLAFAAAEIIARTLGVSRAGYGVIDRTAETITIDRDWQAPGIQSLAGVLNFREYGSYIDDLKLGHTVVFADSDSDPRTASTTEALRAIHARSVVNMPLTEQGDFVALLFVSHHERREWSAEEIAFIRDVAERTRDAVERRRNERELRESVAHYRYAAELNPQVAWTATPDGQLDRVAERWREWTGRSGLGDTWAQGLHPDDRARTGELWAAAIASGLAYDVEHRVQMVSGEHRWARSRAYPRHDAAGQIVKWYGSTEDIHEQRMAQAALQALNGNLEQRVAQRTRELEEAQGALRQSQKLEAMGQLTGGVAHDFNNLLTPIIGGLDIISRRGLAGECERRLLDGALQSAERAKTLVQRLLAFARRQPLQAGAVDVGALVTGMAELVGSTSGPQVRVRVEIDEALPAAQADANQLEMAILNLSVNARDAMPDGGVLTISATRERIAGKHPARLPAGEYVRLAVADTGIGMDAATQAQAIEPFFSTKGIGKGTGLGLSMVHGLALQLGGGLTIDSLLGAGTTVALWLPLSGQAAPREEEAETRTVASDRLGVALLVDDEELVRASTAGMLEELGYDVVEAASAEDALGLIGHGSRFDLLVTDHLMPGMTGAELARAAHRMFPEMPVLVISGYADAEGIAADLERLTKPFREADLQLALERLVARRTHGPA